LFLCGPFLQAGCGSNIVKWRHPAIVFYPDERIQAKVVQNLTLVTIFRSASVRINGQMRTFASATAGDMEIFVFVGIALFFSFFFWSAAKMNKERGL
jgi:hypothetical protein